MCAAKPEVVLKIDTDVVTVKELRDEVLIKSLNMVDPDVMIDGKGVIVISSEEGETECNEDKVLKDLQIVDGCILKVDDFFQNYELTITVLHISTKHDEARFEVIADMDTIKPVEEKPEEPQPGTSGISNGAKKAAANGSEYQDEDDDLICVEDTGKKDDEDLVCTDDTEMDPPAELPAPESSAEKRKVDDVIQEEEDQSPSKKRARIQQEDDDDIVCIDDD